MNGLVPAVEMSSLALFYRDVKRLPLLSREEEYQLATRWRNHHDREAAESLVLSHLHGVAAIAREYRHFGLPEMDLIQEGVMGLMHAVKRFDPEKGFRLMTYASWWIRAAIHDFILRSWSIVKLGTNKIQRRIFAGLQKARDAIAAMEGRHVDEVAADYGISRQDFQEVAHAFLQRDLPLDAEIDGKPVVAELAATGPTPEDQVIDDDWCTYQRGVLAIAMRELPERDRQIIEKRHLSEQPATLRELADELGVSIERVRQLEARALKRLRQTIPSA